MAGVTRATMTPPRRATDRLLTATIRPLRIFSLFAVGSYIIWLPRPLENAKEEGRQAPQLAAGSPAALSCLLLFFALIAVHFFWRTGATPSTRLRSTSRA